MAIDYIIGGSCDVKNAITLDGFLELLKEKIRVEIVIDLFKGQGKSEQEINTASYTSRMVMPDGKVEIKECRISDILQKIKCLQELKIHCSNCAISSNNEFGCYNSINYPISEKAELWLIDLAKRAVKMGEVLRKMPLDFIISNKVMGQDFEKMRKDESKAFFQTYKSHEFVYKKKLFTNKTINTNQLLEVLFGSRIHEHAQQMVLLYFSGGFNILKDKPDDGFSGYLCEVAYENGTSNFYTFNLPEEASDDESIIQIKKYFQSLFSAFCSNRSVYIDY